MQFPQMVALSATLALTACFEKPVLNETLVFPPGLSIEYNGKPAQLYGTSQCAQGQLSGHSCLIFPPAQPEANGVIISGKQMYEVHLKVRKDPQNPVNYIVEDQNGAYVVSSTGRHDAYGNIDIRPHGLTD